MIGPEIIRQQLYEIHQRVSPSLGVPVTWSGIKIPSGNLPEIYAPQEKTMPSASLTIDDLPYLGIRLFDDNTALQDSLNILTGNKVDKVDGLRGSLLTIGHKAHILLFEAVVNNTPCDFVTYLSREPNGSRLAEETEQDYFNLKNLALEFDKRLKPEAKQKYGVINPIALDHVKYKDQEYPFFTMPFIPWGELCINAVVYRDSFQGSETLFPFFQYSVGFTQEMDKIVESQARDALSLTTKYAYGQDEKTLQQLPEAKQHKIQLEDLMRADALAYLLSDGRFPKQHQINAGDWMTIIDNHGLRLKLISVRGGFGTKMNEDEFYQQLKNQIEPSPSHYGLHIQPFGNVTIEQFKEILDQARDLTKSV